VSDIIEQFRSGGELPSGPVSAWPKERNDTLRAQMMPNGDMVLVEYGDKRFAPKQEQATKVRASAGRMAKGLAQTALSALRNGKVSQEVRDERYATCQECPFFVKDSKRCSECGCFMEAKTWVNGDKSFLCPKDKWSR